MDGVDVSDDTVGTITADILSSAIDEFQLSQSSLDLSNDLTPSGARPIPDPRHTPLARNPIQRPGYGSASSKLFYPLLKLRP